MDILNENYEKPFISSERLDNIERSNNRIA